MSQHLNTTYLSPRPFEGPGGSGDHTRAHQPLRATRQSGPLPLRELVFNGKSQGMWLFIFCL